MSPDAERVFKLGLQVFREYLKDCDADIEGCSSLEEIEHCVAACRELRRRFVNLVTGADCDERGVIFGQQPVAPAQEGDDSSKESG